VPPFGGTNWLALEEAERWRVIGEWRERVPASVLSRIDRNDYHRRRAGATSLGPSSTMPPTVACRCAPGGPNAATVRAGAKRPHLCDCGLGRRSHWHRIRRLSMNEETVPSEWMSTWKSACSTSFGALP
jgi:hypothetical protein